MPLIAATPPPEPPAPPAHEVVAESRTVPAEVLARFQKRLPNTPMVSVQPTAVEGIYAVTLEDGKVIFIDKSVRYMTIGAMFDLNTGKVLYTSAPKAKDHEE